ncbi:MULTISPECIES: arylsulfatase [unclassified Sphingobacterium]|uniref:sulfatase family protein n=1 Tax=unclassified Sphingobacterium TaxID=2609468 RepID=UPI00104A846C|nr:MULTISPECIES: arylsulfatase [unclassified Sphingobacterium]MCS3556134.1 arylsulfatase A-like enzyme [Sphingobacterium sp. JUb21]TCR08510.1 arylsulfatase A-like enzyme [Sphingobacterium sp. JUb20]
MRKIILLKAFLLFLFYNESFAQFKPDKPNIIFIMADDMGYGDPQCYNEKSKIPTPNINKLAQGGMLFLDAHSASSVCTPSRYSVINGKYAWKSTLKKEVLWSGYDTPLINSDEVTIADICKKAGYQTAAIGKWHLGVNFLKQTGYSFVVPKDYHEEGLKGTKNVSFTTPTYGGPNDLGFDYFFGILGGQNMEPYAYIKNRYALGNPNQWRGANKPTVPGTSGLEVHEGWMVQNWTDTAIGPTLTQETISFIEKSALAKKNFFIYYTPVAPHRPCTPSSIAKGKSQAGDRGDMVFELDWSIGQIRDKLKELGIEKNTIIIVTSDNGATKVSDDGNDYGHKSCGELKGYKGSLHEGGHRVPFIVYWPDVIKAGAISKALISNLDLMATVSEIIGEPLQSGKDSESFANVLRNEHSSRHRKELIHHTYSGQYAMRIENWKLIPNREENGDWTYELYDIKSDPTEMKNLSKENAAMIPQIIKELESRIFDF